MFPNPSDALPLPPNPNLSQYRKLAKDLVKVCKAGSSDAVRDWTVGFVQHLVELSGAEVSSSAVEQFSQFAAQSMVRGERPCALTSAQLVIARSLGFKSWPKFTTHLEDMALHVSPVSKFEAACDAIVTGDIKRLRELIGSNSDLIKQRSTREHHATLLHYTSANGIEDYRQKTPPNIVEITRFLLESGADVEAEADVYGGGCTTLGLIATSGHPERAGIQDALLQLLLDVGARTDGPNIAGNRQSLIIACLANGRPGAAEFLASRGARLDLEGAAGVGRLDVVETYFGAGREVRAPATKRQLQAGFLWACMYGHEPVVDFLLRHGADFRDPASTGATGLHWAAGGGHVGIVRRLLELGAPLEALNRWGGSVLAQAGYGFENDGSGVDFVPTFETLLQAGATVQDGWLEWIGNLRNRTATDRARVSDVFRHYGAAS